MSALLRLTPLRYSSLKQILGTSLSSRSSSALQILTAFTRRELIKKTHLTLRTLELRQISDFQSAALLAGGVPYNALPSQDPTSPNEAANISDLDGNIITVTMSQHHSNSDSSSVLSWQRDVARSAVAPFPNPPSNYAPSHYSQSQNAPSPRYVQVPPPPQPQITIQPATIIEDLGMGSSKAFVGTLLGAAAGATIAYAMTKAEALDEAAARPPPAPQVTYNISGGNSARSQQSQPSPYDQQPPQMRAIAPAPTAASTISNLISSIHISSPPVPQPRLLEPAPKPAPSYMYEVSEAGSRPSMRQAPRDIGYAEYATVPLPASASTVYSSKHSSRHSSHRDAEYSDYATVPLPASASTVYSSKHSSRHSSPRDAEYSDYATVPLPASASTVYSSASTIKASSRHDGSRLAAPSTVAPSESVSQVSSRHSKHSKSSKRSSRSKKDEEWDIEEVKPADSASSVGSGSGSGRRRKSSHMGGSTASKASKSSKASRKTEKEYQPSPLGMFGGYAGSSIESRAGGSKGYE